VNRWKLGANSSVEVAPQRIDRIDTDDTHQKKGIPCNRRASVGSPSKPQPGCGSDSMASFLPTEEPSGRPLGLAGEFAIALQHRSRHTFSVQIHVHGYSFEI
jgi:hypothetical protein